MLWQSKSSFTAEIQINTKSMIKAKEGKRHKWYESHRVIKESTTEATRTPAQKSSLLELETKMADLHEEAWLK